MVENHMVLAGSDHPAYQPEGFECTECEGKGYIAEMDEDEETGEIVEVGKVWCKH